MTPVLFGAGAATYETQGLGALADALTCEISEELNGEYELELAYPVSGRRYSDLKNRCIIVAKPDPYRGEQPFRIYRITRPLNGVITVYARHISYDLSGVPVTPFTAASAAAAMQALASHAAVSSPFSFWTDISSGSSVAVAVPTSTRAVLGGTDGSILDTYHGEYEWDGFTVRLRSHRGQDNGVRIAYGKNLTDIQQDENIADLATGVIGYWAGSDGTLVQTGVVDAPGTYNFDRIITVDFSSDFEERPSTSELTQRVQQYISDNGVGVPDVSISVSWVNLEQFSGYEGLSLLERVSLGDTVTVEFPPLGVEATARVVKTVYDVLRDRYVSADIGSVQANIADTIAGQQQQLQQVPNKTEIQQIAQSIADAIMGAKGGSVRLLDTNGDGEPDTLYIADNPDPAKAVKVWRFNYAGWCASSNGYNGPFEMSAALGQGMYADFITVGTLTAILIKSADGRATIDLSNGNVSFTGNSLTVNSTNFQLDKGGNVTATGTLRSNNGVTGVGRNEVVLSSGNLTLYRTPNSGDAQEVAILTGYGSNGSAAEFEMYYTGVRQIYLGTDDIGGSAVLENGFGDQTIRLNGSSGSAHFNGSGQFEGQLEVSTTVRCQNLDAWGDKNRIVPTSFGALKMAAMETPEPTFADSGTGCCDEDGLCYIAHDPRYAETIDRCKALQWLATPTSPGALWVEGIDGGAVVHGQPWQTFAWMCLGAQAGYAGSYAEPCHDDPPQPHDPSQVLLGDLDEITKTDVQHADDLLDEEGA